MGKTRSFMAEDNLCAQNLLKLVSHGNAIVAEISRMKDYLPDVFRMDTKELQNKYQDVIMDFSYFKISDSQEKKIAGNSKLQDLDDDLKEQYLELVTRYFQLFENIYQYAADLNSFVEQLRDEMFIQQSIDTILMDVEGKQLLCESLYLYGVMLLTCDLYLAGAARERLLVGYYRYSTEQSQSSVDGVCRLLRATGLAAGRRPGDYPVEYFSRFPLNATFVDRVIAKLRSEDIYNQLSVYTIPEHRCAALAPQANMLFVCLFFAPQTLHSDGAKMREIVDKFFPSNWVACVYMGITINVVDYWENFKAAKAALSNTCGSKTVKEIFSKRGASVSLLTEKIHNLLKEGMLTDDFVLDNTNKILNLVINANFVIRWLMLHSSPVTFHETHKRGKQLRELVQKEANYEPAKLFELLTSTAELELKIREILTRLLAGKLETWTSQKGTALEAINNLSELFSGSKPAIKVQENEQLKAWFDNIAKQIQSLSEPITTKSMKKITQMIQALDEVEEFHGIKSTSTVLQFLNESKDALRNALRIASLKEDSIVILETVADVSYAWETIDSYTKIMQDCIREQPAVTSRLRALFLKLASAMEIPLLRINQARSDDLVSVSQYYSDELIRYIQKVLQIIPEMVFSIVEKIIDLQTWHISELPTRLARDRLREFAQLDRRMEVAELTHRASTFTSGILDMRSTLVGVVRVDPAQLLEEGLRRELDRHLRRRLDELEPRGPLAPRLERLAAAMAGYKRSLEYIQDYINMHGLKIWQKQLSALVAASVSREVSVRKGVPLVAPSAGFAGSLARQLAQLVDARACTYVSVSAAWLDARTHVEVVGTKTFAKLQDAVGVAGLHGLDTLYAYMVRHQLNAIQQILRLAPEKITVFENSDGSQMVKDVEQELLKRQKTLQQLTEAVVLVGTLQLLRRHIAHQLNTSCKFDSAHLEGSLRTLNESLLLEVGGGRAVPGPLLRAVTRHLERAGAVDPLGQLLAGGGGAGGGGAGAGGWADAPAHLCLMVLALGSRLVVCPTTGELVARRAGDPADGAPLLAGARCVLRQARGEDAFVETLCAYVRRGALARSSEAVTDNTILIRTLELFCEYFDYPYSKLEDLLPLALLTNNVTVK